MSKSNSIVLAGCGYTGRALSQVLADNGFEVNALVASERSHQRLIGMGVHSARWDLDSDRPPPELPARFAFSYLVPPSREGLSDTRLTRCLSHLPTHPTRFVYVSTTGVYGDHDGRRVSEETPVAPASARAKRRVDAETQVRAWCDRHAIPWVILRTPAIYGPGRLPLESIRSQRPIINPAEAAPGNRIHREDLAVIISQALTDPGMLGLFNVGDGNHMNSSNFTLQVARLAGLTPPPLISRVQMQNTASPRRWSFLKEARQVDTSRLQAHLRQELRYADPLEGIKASLHSSL